MKKLICLALFLLIGVACFAQVKIHSHNDYLQQEPFFTAYQNKIFEIEVDVFLVGDSLIVAHSRKEIDPKNTLGKIYLDPIAQLFKQNIKRVSNDKQYTFSLMIDIKDEWGKVYPVLKREIEKYGSIFKRSNRKLNIQLVISGNRPEFTKFHTYPNWLFFDGLPNINYPKVDFKKVTMISDKFTNYSKWNEVGEISSADQKKLLEAVKKANLKNRYFRFWGAPDNKDCWQQLSKLGLVIINTDKIEECKTYFENKNGL
ncbi:PI-PLC domain-containing protein [Pedobacter cryotolerans]|uniref:Glycerophosphodiester phosphodiesterase n=1 Tax=Pedobacter cryotolerans TaxID=2571270 RepID=A0A4U1C6Y8_9SPHI|nr:glycerophosphodiester phosphodiesterase [Pedobacter cryotolerans]TKC01275.1 glycerophosphodiester phosphodiesterase [Pedobacter cryotolerans]